MAALADPSDLPTPPEGMEWVWVGEAPPAPAPEGMEWVRVDDSSETQTTVGPPEPQATLDVESVTEERALERPDSEALVVPDLFSGLGTRERRRHPAWMANLVTVAIAFVALLVMLGLASLL